MASKKKVATTVVAVATAAALLLGGTFAWQSISQRALNEASDVINPGGRLHDDFNGSNKDVYVENFATEDIYARVRFDEYMEIVMNYNSAAKKTEIVTAPATKTDLNTYRTHLFDGENPTDDYWNWTMGSVDSGAVYYMPTFNLNKDSLAADVNGVFNGANFQIKDKKDVEYIGYTEYTADSTKEGYEIYDGDTNNVDELSQKYTALNDLTTAVNEIINTGNFADYKDNLVLSDEKVPHTATETNLTNGFISMAEWLEKLGNDEDTSNYWVYDVDGWCYWSSPIPAGETTGLLMDGIALNGAMDDTWYYAINVVGQFITADDAGAGDGTGFYDTNAGTKPSPDAETLLKAIGVTLDGDEEEDDGEQFFSMINLWHDSDDEVKGGEFILFDAVVYDENGQETAYTKDVTFTVKEVTGSETAAFALFEKTTMDENALFVAEDVVERGVSSIVVSATYADENGTTYEGEYTLDVKPGVSPLSIGLSIDGREMSYYDEENQVYQFFSANYNEKTYKFSAELDDVSTDDVTWSITVGEEDMGYTVGTEDGICYAYADISDESTSMYDWGTVKDGDKVAKINPTTGEFNALLGEENFPRGMHFYITATSGDYTNTCTLVLNRVDVNFQLLNADADDLDSIDAHSATYTKGKDTTINIAFSLVIKDKQAAVNTTLLQNWKLYEGRSSNNGVLIDKSLYDIKVKDGTSATLTIPASSDITAEYLCLTVEYNHGIKAPRTPDGISESAPLQITESSVTAGEDEVDRLEITDEYGDSSATYTPGTYQKIKLSAAPRTSNGGYVGAGSVTWHLESVENVRLEKTGNFTAEVWIFKADAEKITVKAVYSKEGETAVHKDAFFVITAATGEGGDDETGGEAAYKNVVVYGGTAPNEANMLSTGTTTVTLYDANGNAFDFSEGSGNYLALSVDGENWYVNFFDPNGFDATSLLGKTPSAIATKLGVAKLDEAPEEMSVVDSSQIVWQDTQYLFIYYDVIHEYVQSYEYNGTTYFVMKDLVAENNTLCVIDPSNFQDGEQVEGCIIYSTNVTDVSSIDWENLTSCGKCKSEKPTT